MFTTCLLARVCLAAGRSLEALTALGEVIPTNAADTARIRAWRARALVVAGERELAEAEAEAAMAAARGQAAPIQAEVFANVEGVISGLSLPPSLGRPAARMLRLEWLLARLRRQLLVSDVEGACGTLARARRLARWIEAGLVPDDRAAWRLQRIVWGVWDGP